MPVTLSVKRRLRSEKRKYVINRAYRSKTRKSIRRFYDSLRGNDVEVMQLAFRKAQSQMSSAVSKGIMNRRYLARKVSRMNSSLKKVVLSN